MSVAEGGRGVSKMLTMVDKGGRWVRQMLPLADKGERVLASNHITDKIAKNKKYAGFLKHIFFIFYLGYNTVFVLNSGRSNTF